MGLRKSSTPGTFTHSVNLTGTCTNPTCRASLSLPHTFDAPMGWMGQVQGSAHCSCGTTSNVSVWTG